MNCLSKQTLLDLLNDIPVSDRNGLLEHLDSCASCQQQLDVVSAEGTDFSVLASSETPSSSSLQAVMQRLKTGKFATQREEESEGDIIGIGDLDHYFDRHDSIQTLGKFSTYDVSSSIGAGGMGIVLRAYDESLEREVAIKVLPPHAARSNDSRERFLREARAAAAIEHENVVSIYVVDEFKELPYFVMQLVDGETLQQRIFDAAPLSQSDIVDIARQSARGLAAAHRRNVIHRDIKPANILLERNTGRILLTDFGLAKAAGTPSLTNTGVTPGTPNFMSPEQAMGQPATVRSDLFSLGTVLYAAASGQSPFEASSVYATLRNVCEKTPEPIANFNPSLSSELCEIIERLMRKSPEERFQSAAELEASLNRVGQSATKTSTQLVKSSRPDKGGLRTPLKLWPWPIGILASCIVLFALMQSGILNFTQDKKDHNLGDASEVTSPATDESGVFFVAGSGRNFNSLDEAIAEVKNDGTIEIRSDDEIHVSEQVIVGKSVSLVAGEDFSPTIVQTNESAQWLSFEGPMLKLVGIRFQQANFSPPFGVNFNNWMHNAFLSIDGDLVVEDCRFEVSNRSAAIGFYGNECQIRRTKIRAQNASGVKWHCIEGSRVTTENSTFQGRYGVLSFRSLDNGQTALKMDRCTFDTELAILTGKPPMSSSSTFTSDAKYKIKAERCLFRTDQLFGCFRSLRFAESEVSAFLEDTLEWRGQQNVYAGVEEFVSLTRGRPNSSQPIVMNFKEWVEGRDELSATADIDLTDKGDGGLKPMNVNWVDGSVDEFGAN